MLYGFASDLKMTVIAEKNNLRNVQLQIGKDFKYPGKTGIMYLENNNRN